MNDQIDKSFSITERDARQNRVDVALPRPLPAYASSSEENDALALRDYWQVISRRRGVVMLFAFLVLIGTVVASLVATPIFRASLTLQIEREASKVVQFQDVVPVESPMDKDFYQTQYELLESRTLVRRVIDQLGLMNHPAMIVRGGWLRQWINGVSGAGGDEASEDVRRSQMIETFFEQLYIEPIRQSRLVRIDFSSPDAQLSARVVNALADNFIQMNIERRIDASSYAKSFLEDRLTQVKIRLEESEQKLVAFARAHEIIKLDDHRTLQLQKLNELTSALGKAEKSRIDTQGLYQLAKQGEVDALPQILLSPVIQQYKQAKASLEAEYQDRLRIFKPEFPVMRQLDSQIEQMRAKIAEETAVIVRGVEADYALARSQEKAFLVELRKLKQDVLQVQDSSIEYNILQREVDTNRELYDGLLARMKEVGIAGGMTANNISIVDAADVPLEKYRPRLALNIAVALLLGVAGGIVLVFLVDHFDDTLKSVEELERRIHLPVLGVTPQVRGQRGEKFAADIALTAHYDPRDGLAEAYRSVRTALLFSTARGAPKIALFTSPGPGEGKTTSAVNVAITFTQTGHRVLLIDADLRNPSLHHVFALDNRAGLTNYLAAEAIPGDITQSTEVPGLFVMTTGPLPPNPAELLSSDKMTALLALAAEKFDYVVLDGPPVLGLADALVLSNKVEGTILVVEAGATRRGALSGTVKRLRSAHANVLGAVLAKQREDSVDYGYHHYYYYAADDENPLLPKG